MDNSWKEAEAQENKQLGDGVHHVDTDSSSQEGTSQQDDVCWWEQDDVKVRRKLDWHIVPLLCVCYVFAFLDRSNIGNAKTGE